LLSKGVDGHMVPEDVRTFPCPAQAQYAAAKKAMRMAKIMMARSEGSQFIAIQHTVSAGQIGANHKHPARMSSGSAARALRDQTGQAYIVGESAKPHKLRTY